LRLVIVLLEGSIEVSHNFACWGFENLFSYTGFGVTSARPRPTYPTTPDRFGHVALPELKIESELRDLLTADQKREIRAPGPKFKAVIAASFL
jgi:hypothetical protein